MTAKSFIELWKEFDQDVIQPESNLFSIWNSNSDWTKFIIGSKTSSHNSDSPLGNFIMKKTALDYRKEDGLVDLTFATNESFEGIRTLEYPSEAARKTFLLSGVYYPKTYEVLVEHENDTTKCWEEMTKLTYFRAKLKVLITYNWDVDIKCDYQYVNGILFENFRDIIRASTSKLSEDPTTEYLLIIGQRDHQKKLTWKYFVIH